MKKDKLKSDLDLNRIKVQIDYKTIITVRNTQALEMWLSKYPDAKVLDK